LPAFESKKYPAYDRFHGNGPYGEIPTKKGPIRTLGFALPYNNVVYLDKKNTEEILINHKGTRMVKDGEHHGEQMTNLQYLG